MIDPIEPALTAEEWAIEPSPNPNGVAAPYWIPTEEAPRYIALLNHALPDSDSRKITREMTEQLRVFEHSWRATGNVMIADQIGAIADALESYLPPGGA